MRTMTTRPQTLLCRKARFLHRQGYPPARADQIARDPPHDLLGQDHPDLERCLEICCQVREVDLGVDEDTLEQEVELETAQIEQHQGTPHAAGFRSWGQPWAAAGVPPSGAARAWHGRDRGDQVNVFAKNGLIVRDPMGPPPPPICPLPLVMFLYQDSSRECVGQPAARCLGPDF